MQFSATIPDEQFLMPVLTVTGRYGFAANLYAMMSSKQSDYIIGIIIEESGYCVPEESATLLVKPLLTFFSF